ncbi:MAG TPA: hypothetical protein PL001_12820, partial [Candidatus Kryptobacter bacterium]|nr:hypothetical protein [Candidatus Kryptobacter bacterium]
HVRWNPLSKVDDITFAEFKRCPRSDDCSMIGYETRQPESRMIRLKTVGRIAGIHRIEYAHDTLAMLILNIRAEHYIVDKMFGDNDRLSP